MGANDSQEKYMVMLDAILCEIQGLRRDLQDRAVAVFDGSESSDDVIVSDGAYNQFLDWTRPPKGSVAAKLEALIDRSQSAIAELTVQAETARKGGRVDDSMSDPQTPTEPFGAAWERLRQRWREVERLTAEAETAKIIARIDTILQRASFASMAAEWGGAEVDPGEDVQNEPILGKPDDALEAYGFPEPERDERIHPVMAGVLSGHLRATRGVQ